MKKISRLFLAALLTLALTACGGGGSKETSTQGQSSTPAQGAKEKWPDKPINLIISYAAGGDTDVGARLLMPYVEKELGVPINIINKPGGGGWIGWTELANANPDGYTIGYINVPNLMTGYLDPKQKRKENLDSFAPIANHITDPGIIAIRKDEKRFTDIPSLMEFAKHNELTITSNGVGSDEHYVALMLNRDYGTKFTPVHNKGVAESQAALIGGHIDVMFANVGGAAKLHKDGELKVIGVMSEERSPFLPEVPTLKESGIDIVSGSSRGIAAPKGVDPEKLEILRAALKKGITNEEQIKKQGESGLQVDYKDGQDYINLLKKYEQDVLGLRSLLGW
jgi:tripartite-type tricarboxylate transporter receptor subunit TctC